MAWATALQTSAPKFSAPLALEHRLLFSYLGAFAAIFVVAAVAVRFAFVAIIDQQTTARLHDIARAGIRSVVFGRRLGVDRGDLANTAFLMTHDEGLQWFDRSGRLLATQGSPPQSRSSRKLFDSVSIPIETPKTHEHVGTIVASEWSDQKRADVRYLDTGLLIGTLLAVVGATASGLALARRAVRPVEQSFQVLREFTDNASHELRGPLTVIAASADAALRDTDRDHDRARFETIADGAKQMSRLAGDLLLLTSADQSLERELFLVDLGEMLRKLADQYRDRFAEAQISFDVAIERPAMLFGNPDQIERVIANLIENALRYTRPGGRVSVECRRQGAEFQVAVRDSGIGIALENRDRIFDRFWRADPARLPRGSGLGLAIARALARRHGGDVTVISDVGSGSTFVLSLPARPPSRSVRSRA
jgi:two-component system, OmpR family, manganese sensing sensor histidine kinase